MIEDWLLYKSDSLENAFPIQITREMFNKELVVWNDRFEPIPLTPEILEKNGFEIIDNMYPFPTFRCDDRENYLCITIGFPEGNKTRRKYPFIEIYGKDIYVDYLIINFVHQLQHALKLCGIEKEIKV